MHTVTCDIKKSSPVIAYLRKNMTGSRSVRNTANFLIRNVYTALGKPEELRTPNENSVLIKVWMCLDQANKNKVKAYEKKAKAGDPGKLKLFTIPDEKHRMLWYEQLDAILKLSEDPAYYGCTSQVNQQAIRKTCKSWKAYFEVLAAWKEHPQDFTGKPNIPGYIRDEMSTAAYTNQVCSLRTEGDNVIVRFSEYGELNIGAVPVNGKFVKAETKPLPDGVRLLLTFDNGEIVVPVPVKPGRIMSIDPGVGNFASCVTNTGMLPFIVDGHYLKSVNQFYNKQQARLHSILTEGKDPKDRTVQRTSKQLRRISDRRDRRIRDFFYKAAHLIARRAAEEGVELILYGHNPGQKQNIHTGHVNNQSFVQIPYGKFYDTLRFVAAKYKIAVDLQEESYTSQADHLMRDRIYTYATDDVDGIAFSGKRVRRGLYKSGSGVLLNADVNGAANILRKRFPNAFDENEVCLSVQRYTVQDLIPSRKTA